MKLFLFLIFTFYNLEALATRYQLPPKDINLIGKIEIIEALQGEQFSDIGQKYNIGFDNLHYANRGLYGTKNIDALYLKQGEKIILPTRFILPDAPREGIVVNLPELRLYHYSDDGKYVDIYAIGIGREGWRTPEGSFSVIEKRQNPTWTPPASIRKEHAEQGDILPAVVPAGPDNPLGLFAMRLSDPSYLIHGTNKPEGVGMAVSHGCIRMYPAGIEELFSRVPKGIKVHIVNQPMKVANFAGETYLEYHLPLKYRTEDTPAVLNESALLEEIKIAQEFIASKSDVNPSPEKIAQVVHEHTGLPVAVAINE